MSSLLKGLMLLGMLSMLALKIARGKCIAEYEQTCQEKSEVPKAFRNLFHALNVNGGSCLRGENGFFCFVDGNNSRVAKCDPTKKGCDGSDRGPSACDKSPTSKECYCDLDDEHTMCVYPAGVDNGNCGKILSRAITRQEDKDAIVSKHNELRRKVAKGEESRGVGGVKQPPATNMYKLKWNDELATVAQRWADQCVFEHDKSRGTMQFLNVGQNTAMGRTAAMEEGGKHIYTYAQHIQGWYDEVKKFPAANVGKFSNKGATGDKVIGHYTQTVWGATKEVGCGIVLFENPNHKESVGGVMPIIEILVCNYGPRGNFPPDVPVYTAGETASDCPNGSDDGLCI